MSARNPLIVRADICGFSARSSAEKVKFSVSCTVGVCVCVLVCAVCCDKQVSPGHVYVMR